MDEMNLIFIQYKLRGDNMLNKKILITISVLSIIIVLICVSIYMINDKTLEKNYGPAYMTINGIVGDDGVNTTVTDIDAVVPDEDELIKNLTDEDYNVTSYDVIDGLDVSVNRVHAEKKNSFIDIAYALSAEDAKQVFDYYEDTYKDYYLLAQNRNYVYCISDKKTFEKAGFTSLANDGVQYIRR